VIVVFTGERCLSPETVDQARELPDALEERQRIVFDDMRTASQALRQARERRQLAEHDARRAALEEVRLTAYERAVRERGTATGDSLTESNLEAARAHRAALEADAQVARLREEERQVENAFEARLRKMETYRGIRTPLDREYYEWLAANLAREPDSRPPAGDYKEC